MKNNKVDIYFKDGKYIVDATIHTEVETDDIAKVQEQFNVDCAYNFAEALKQFINYGHNISQLFDQQPSLKYYTYKFFNE